jgi:hypothetical protein
MRDTIINLGREICGKFTAGLIVQAGFTAGLIVQAARHFIMVSENVIQ